MKRIEKQKEVVSLMIKLYCNENHSSNKLCSCCEELQGYAYNRIDNCRHGDNKTSCAKCLTPCYKTDMRTKIKEVMRFSGPRLMIYRPNEFLRHIAK